MGATLIRKATDFELVEAENGNVVVEANGIPVVEFTTSGYLRRLRHVEAGTGLRQLPDGRVAIKPKRVA